jgi:hypothetical protein
MPAGYLLQDRHGGSGVAERYSDMAICKRCGCAIPLGSKKCDMCATTDAIAPVQPISSIPPQAPVTWNPPEQAAWSPPQQSSTPSAVVGSTPTWPSTPSPVQGATVPATDVAASLKAKKALRQAFWLFVIVGGISVGLGVLAELGEISALLGFFNWYSVGEGAIFLVLAYFTWRGSLIAAIIGAGLYVLDSILLLITGYFSIVRVAIIIGLARTILSAYTFRQQAKQLSTQQGAAAPSDQMRAA